MHPEEVPHYLWLEGGDPLIPCVLEVQRRIHRAEIDDLADKKAKEKAKELLKGLLDSLDDEISTLEENLKAVLRNIPEGDQREVEAQMELFRERITEIEQKA